LGLLRGWSKGFQFKIKTNIWLVLPRQTKTSMWGSSLCIIKISMIENKTVYRAGNRCRVSPQLTLVFRAHFYTISC
jgi:hypothetical protein